MFYSLRIDRQDGSCWEMLGTDGDALFGGNSRKLERARPEHTDGFVDTCLQERQLSSIVVRDDPIYTAALLHRRLDFIFRPLPNVWVSDHEVDKGLESA